MLVFQDHFEFSTDVVVNVPSKAGFDKCIIKATFKFCRDDVLTPLLASGDDNAVLRQVTVDIDGIGDVDGKPLPFTVERFEAWLKVAYFRTALIRGFMSANAGVERGN